MADKERQKTDPVHLNAIHVETCRKEQKHEKLYTQFSINPHRKFHILPDKPNAETPMGLMELNSEFIDAFHKARLVPTKKYSEPQTSSQEIGWVSTPLIPPNRSDKRINFHRGITDVTKYMEYALRKGT